MTLEDAKNLIARRNGADSWLDFVKNNIHCCSTTQMWSLIEQAAEIYAEAKWHECYLATCNEIFQPGGTLNLQPKRPQFKERIECCTDGIKGTALNPKTGELSAVMLSEVVVKMTPKTLSENDIHNYLERNIDKYVFRCVVLPNGHAYIHALNKDSETLTFNINVRQEGEGKA